jgi:hypothetical protein
MIRVSGVPYEVNEEDLCSSNITKIGTSSSTFLRSTDQVTKEALELAMDALLEWMHTRKTSDFDAATMKSLAAITAIDIAMEANNGIRQDSSTMP